MELGREAAGGVSAYLNDWHFTHFLFYSELPLESYGEITSVKISQDSRYALISHGPNVSLFSVLTLKVADCSSYRNFNYGIWKVLDWLKHILVIGQEGMSFGVVLEALINISLQVGVRVSWSNTNILSYHLADSRLSSWKDLHMATRNRCSASNA